MEGINGMRGSISDIGGGSKNMPWHWILQDKKLEIT
jgi:hypothetical protein